MAISYPRRTTTGGIWKVTDVAKNLLKHGTWPGSVVPGTRGIFQQGSSDPNVSPGGAVNLEYITIATTGNATDFGDAVALRERGGSGGASATRGIFMGGFTTSIPALTFYNNIEYVTIAHTGNMADFGDISVAKYGVTMASNQTRAIGFSGATPTVVNVVEYITIASTGNAADFGDTTARVNSWCNNSPTRGLHAGGQGPVTNLIEFVEMATLGNSVDFGDLTVARNSSGGASSATRGLSGGGRNGGIQDTIDYITMASKGDATDFGNLTTDRKYLGGTSSSTRGIFSGGTPYNAPSSPSHANIIDYVTMASTGNATDFGDTTFGSTSGSSYSKGFSDGHGGLEAYDPRLIPITGNRGIFAGGSAPGHVNVIEYITITTLGNGVDFGDLTGVRTSLGSGASSGTRGVFIGGENPSGNVDILDSIDFLSLGNAADFGDLTAVRRSIAGFSSATRGISGGGGHPEVNVIEYFTIATAGDAADFGDLTEARKDPGGLSSSTRGVIGGGRTPSDSDVIDYITIASTGDAADFGDLTGARAGGSGGLAGISSPTRGVFGASQGSNVIDYITIASTGDATDFGDLSSQRDAEGVNSPTRGVFGGGKDPSAISNVLDYITIASTGNATDFGDIIAAKSYLGGFSNGHGGLQG